MISATAIPTSEGPIGLRAEPGDVILLRGPNGCGKTSLLRALAGLPSAIAPRETRMDGADPRALAADQLAQRVRLVPQDARDALVGLTVRGEFALRNRPIPPGALWLAARDVATLSSGEARRLAIQLASHPAPLLLLDEPAEGLDAAGREQLLALIRDARAAGAIVVAADHSGALDAVATRVMQLGEAATATLARIPRRDGDARLTAPAVRIERDGTVVALPAITRGPGFHALVGPNGSGKSTLLLRLAGVEHADGATVDGARPRPGDTVALLLPRARDHLLADTVADEVARADAAIREQLVEDALAARHPLTLSGGEVQRVALAKTLGEPRGVYLLDEPEAHLDSAGREALVSVIARRVAEGACVFAATHDATLAALAQSVVHLERAP